MFCFNDEELSKLHCYVEDTVRHNKTKFCVVCFIGKDDVIDISVTDCYCSTIMDFIKENPEDVNKEGFYINVLSTSTLMKILEVLNK